jgi:hypothetical protein
VARDYDGDVGIPFFQRDQLSLESGEVGGVPVDGDLFVLIDRDAL